MLCSVLLSYIINTAIEGRGVLQILRQRGWKGKGSIEGKRHEIAAEYFTVNPLIREFLII